MAKTLKELESAYSRLVARDTAESDRAASFPRGVGMVKNRKSRDREIDASVTRACRLTALASDIERARKLVEDLPRNRSVLIELDAIISSGIVKGKKMSADQRLFAKSKRAEISRAIRDAERLSS